MDQKYITPNRATTQLYMLMADNNWLYGTTSGLNPRAFFYTRGTFKLVDATPEQETILTRSNWVHGMLEKVEPKNEKNALHWSASAYRLTDKAREWLKTERPKVEAWLAEKAAKDSKTERLAIIREWSPRFDSEHFGVREHIHGLFRITSETEKRLYGELVLPIKTERRYLSDYNLGHGGRRTKTYIDRGQIVVDNATPEMYNRLLKVDREWMIDLDQQQVKFDAELVELQARYKKNTVQGAAMYADMLREAGAPKEAVDRIMDEVRSEAEETEY